MSAQFFGRSGKVLYGAFSIVGMAYQSQNVNNGIPDDRVARSNNLLSVFRFMKLNLRSEPVPQTCVNYGA